MIFRRFLSGLVFSLLAATLGCGEPSAQSTASRREVVVAAAANLAAVVEELTERFEEHTGIRAVVSMGSTASLAHQIENGAPFDVFLAADTEHVDRLVEQGLIAAESRRVYARGVLVVWSASGAVAGPGDLTSPRFKVIAVPKPEVAPYGFAAVEALKALKLWSAIEPKIVYAQNVAMAKQFAESRNADAAFTANSLVLSGDASEAPDALVIPSRLHAPLDQALGIVARSPSPHAAEAFATFLLSDEVQTWLEARGYRRVPAAESMDR